MKKPLLLCLSLLLTACLPVATPPPRGQTQASSSVSADLPGIGTAGSGSTLDLGKDGAPLTLLLFTNHACGYCRDFQETLLPRLRGDYIDEGTLRLRTALLPIRKYPASAPEASALFCAGKQGKGWNMHQALFAVADHGEKAIAATAASLKLDEAAFAACLASPDAAAFARKQEELSVAYDITLVPTFIIGDEKHVGLPTYADLRGWIENEKTGR